MGSWVFCHSLLAMTLLAPLLLQLEIAERKTSDLWRETPWDEKGFELNENLIRSLRNAIIAIDPTAYEIL